VSLRDRRIVARLVALVAVLALVAVACSDDDDDGKSSTTTAGATGGVPTGGTLVFGLEQEPDCLDWLGSCATVAYGHWSANVTTVPRAFSVEKSGDTFEYVPTSLLTDEPKLDESGAKPKVTYNLNPKAVWSDGEPITSSDFKYVWEQVTTGEDINDTTGYDKIESVDDSEPDTAVVTFKEPYADWRSLFGSTYGVLPSHLLEGKDRAAEMANGYTWSGGPWKIDSWSKGDNLTLVPNDAYWGPKPKLDKVVFRFVPDTPSEFRAFKDGEVEGIYPQPSIEIVEQITAAGIPDANAQYTAETANTEGLWINTEKAPFDDVKVRQALAYSIDRDAVVNRIFGKIGVKRALQDVTPPILKEYGDPTAFAKYKLDLDEVTELMTDAGWKKGGDGIWAKGGKKASVEMFSTAGNKTRELILQVVQTQLKAAGFDASIELLAPPDLFPDHVLIGEYNLLLLSRRAGSFYPESCALFCSKNIPTPENDLSGQNIDRVNDPKLDEAYLAGETEMDTEKAQALNKKGNRILAENVYFLPIDPLPNILLTSKQVVGSVEDNPVMGPFWKMWGWGLKK
jgi:peptide/nickel transport system substrate-binding protein